NYGAGIYVSQVFTALALSGRSSEASRLLSRATAYRQANVVPLLQNPTTSLKGGFWSEGWGYGELASENLVLAGLALEGAGGVTATAEHQWASEVITSVFSEQTTNAPVDMGGGDIRSGTIYDGGDWYAYPSPFPTKGLFYVMGYASNDAATR